MSKRHRQQASNRIAAVTYYEGDDKAAIDRIAREVLGERLH